MFSLYLKVKGDKPNLIRCYGNLDYARETAEEIASAFYSSSLLIIRDRAGKTVYQKNGTKEAKGV